MPGYVLVSAKGAPGVTTVAATLAAVATTQSESLFVELDPAGGSVQMLARGAATSGLVEAAGLLRRDPMQVQAVLESTVMMPDNVRALIAPTVGQTAESVIRSLATRWLPVLGACAPLVFVDGGRWSSSQRSAQRIVGADLLVVVCRPTLEGVEHTRHIVRALRETAGQQVAVVLVGNKPYHPEEVAYHLGTPLAGSLPWEPRGAAILWMKGASRVWLRSRLARSAAGVLQRLQELVPPTPALGAAMPAAPDPTANNGSRQPTPPGGALDAAVRPTPPSGYAASSPERPPPPPDRETGVPPVPPQPEMHDTTWRVRR